jgi:hypothetical protein
MASRRDFVAGGIALAAVTAAPLKTALARTAWHPQPSPDADLIVVVDRAFSSAGAFAADAAGRGLRVHAYEDDAAALWMNELEPRLRGGPLAIAALTGPAGAFCLETLACSYRARVLARHEHARGSIARLAPLLVARTQAGGALPFFAHVHRAPQAAPAFLTWLIVSRG